MGEDRYHIGKYPLQFSEMDDDYICLCTFPYNDQGELTPDRVRSLALLGAAVVLARSCSLEHPFLPACVPEWIRKEIDRVMNYHPEEENGDCQDVLSKL